MFQSEMARKWSGAWWAWGGPSSPPCVWPGQLAPPLYGCLQRQKKEMNIYYRVGYFICYYNHKVRINCQHKRFLFFRREGGGTNVAHTYLPLHTNAQDNKGRGADDTHRHIRLKSHGQPHKTFTATPRRHLHSNINAFK